MQLELAKTEQLQDIMTCIEDGRNALKKQGLYQWQEDYPSPTDILADLEAQNSYVLIEENQILGTVALVTGGEPVYETLTEGSWIYKAPYLTIHRMAISAAFSGKGIGTLFLQQIERVALDKGLRHIRLDTHEHNEPMQRIAEKCHYRYAGKVSYGEDFDCVAFEKELRL